MRQEQKEVDGFELGHAEERKRESELIEQDGEELLDLDGKPAFEREQARTSVVACAMQKIFDRDHIVLGDLALDHRELRALEALKTAVDGRDQQINGFVFAEDRHALLEQALAVLQPDLASLEKVGGAMFEELVKDVAELRDELGGLEDAQGELEHDTVAAKGEASDTADNSDEDTSLDGPERVIEKPASSLAAGPAVEPAVKQATTLGDPKEIAEAARPWWKK